MIVSLVPIGLALALALARGGTLTNWARVRVRGWTIAVACLLLQVVLFDPPINRQPWAIAWGNWLWVGILAVILAVLLRNSVRDRRPTVLLVPAIAVALNLTTVLANGGHMPRSIEASMIAKGQPPIALAAMAEPKLSNTVPMTADSRLTWLADNFPVPSWVPMANVFSVGDILLSLGLATWAYKVTRRGGTDAALPRQVVPSPSGI